MAYTKSRQIRRKSYNPFGIAVGVILLIGILYTATVLIGAGVLTSNGHFGDQTYLDVLKTADTWNVFSLFKDL